MSEEQSPAPAAPVAAAGEAVRISDLLCDPSFDARQTEEPASTVLHEADAPAHDIYFIRTGQVRVFLPGADASSARLVEILGPGDWFGVASLAGSAVYGSRAVAVTAAGVCRVPADRLLANLPRVPALAAELIRQLAQKLQAAHEDAATLVFEDTNHRLIKTLLQFSRSAAASPEQGGAGGRTAHHPPATRPGRRRRPRDGQPRPHPVAPAEPPPHRPQPALVQPGALEQFSRRGKVEEGEKAT